MLSRPLCILIFAILILSPSCKPSPSTGVPGSPNTEPVQKSKTLEERASDPAAEDDPSSMEGAALLFGRALRSGSVDDAVSYANRDYFRTTVLVECGEPPYPEPEVVVIEDDEKTLKNRFEEMMPGGLGARRSIWRCLMACGGRSFGWPVGVRRVVRPGGLLACDAPPQLTQWATAGLALHWG